MIDLTHISHPCGEPNINNMYNPNDSYFSHPYGTRNNGHEMIGTKQKQHNIKRLKRHVKKRVKSKGAKRREREAERLHKKAQSPGVPPNTCPYIDVVQTMVTDLQNSYDRLRERGEHNPTVDNISQHAQDTLELIRNANETLRDNSAYWYEQYKQQLTK